MKAIEVKSLVKKYGDVTAVDNISFSVDKGSICAILGPNGSGKTTTIKSICDIIHPDSGIIKLEGKNNKKSTDKIAAIFEGTRNLYWRLTPRENIRYFAGIRGYGGKKIERTIDELLERFRLSDKKNVMVNNLSRGMQQKVAIAMTLICNTNIVLMDEPTLGLDMESFMDIKNLLRDIAENMKKTILLSTHDMNLVQDVCDKAVILNKGKVVAEDTMSSLLEMFKSRTYMFVLSNKVTLEDKNYLTQFHYNFNFLKDDSILEVDIADLNEIYNIINILKEKGLYIKEVKQEEINFDSVYLNLTSGGKINEKNILSV